MADSTICAPPSNALFQRPGFATSLALRHFATAGLRKERDSDLSDAELRAAGRHRSARQLPTYAKRTRKQLVSGAQKRRAERTKPAVLSE